MIAAIIRLHEEGEPLTADAISLSINETEEDADMSARKVGWIMARIGLKKARVGKMGRRTVVWDESRMARIAMQYGIAMRTASRPETTAETSAMSAVNTKQADVSAAGVE